MGSADLSYFRSGFEIVPYTAGLRFYRSVSSKETLDRYGPCGETPRWRTGGRCPSRSSGNPVDKQRRTHGEMWGEEEARDKQRDTKKY